MAVAESATGFEVEAKGEAAATREASTAAVAATREAATVAAAATREAAALSISNADMGGGQGAVEASAARSISPKTPDNGLWDRRVDPESFADKGMAKRESAGSTKRPGSGGGGRGGGGGGGGDAGGGVGGVGGAGGDGMAIGRREPGAYPWSPISRHSSGSGISKHKKSW
tara:strand:- start:123 stop:635 length:513 start_codon:yes stop_codon:yes gene_type:complete